MHKRESSVDECSVVYIHNLHTDVKPRILHDPDQSGKFVVEIEGKKRPVLVLGRHLRVSIATAKKSSHVPDDQGCHLYEAVAVEGYWVLPIQSKIPHGMEKYFLPLPKDCLGIRHDSVVSLEMKSVPAECVDMQSTREHRAAARWIVDEVVKQLTHRQLSWYPA